MKIHDVLRILKAHASSNYDVVFADGMAVKAVIPFLQYENIVITDENEEEEGDDN